MTAKEANERLGLGMTRAALHASAFLESRGGRFFIDFGYANAVDVARTRWNSLRHEIEARRKARRRGL